MDFAALAIVFVCILFAAVLLFSAITLSK